jgi:hypothetical protein
MPWYIFQKLRKDYLKIFTMNEETIDFKRVYLEKENNRG